jgi:hypothetical protein
MEFRTSHTSTPPKNLYPCLATLTIGGDKSSRRTSTSGDDEGGLRRVISGNRRKTSFGQVADRGDTYGPRKSLDGGATGAGGLEKGTWYWRVQAGVDDVSPHL